MKELLSDIIDRHFDVNYKFKTMLIMNNGQSCFREYDQKYKTDEINNSEIDIPEKI